MGTNEFLSRVLKERLDTTQPAQDQLNQLYRYVTLGRRHLKRYEIAEENLRQAIKEKDAVTEQYERQIMMTNLYATMDHGFLALAAVDIDALNIVSAMSGLGLTGDDAMPFIDHLQQLDEFSCYVLEKEAEMDFVLDFGIPVNEILGRTYTEKPHWKRYASTMEESFRDYFRAQKELLSDKLVQIPKDWRVSIGEYLEGRNEYDNLSRIVDRLVKSKHVWE